MRTNSQNGTAANGGGRSAEIQHDTNVVRLVEERAAVHELSAMRRIDRDLGGTGSGAKIAELVGLDPSTHPERVAEHLRLNAADAELVLDRARRGRRRHRFAAVVTALGLALVFAVASALAWLQGWLVIAWLLLLPACWLLVFPLRLGRRDVWWEGLPR